MIEYTKEVLDNGLSVIVHEDPSTPLVAVNILYKVGSKDEDPNRTGFTHLFEHLMFSGSKHVPDFDAVIQNAGGENNAFTNNDITNFYNIAPAENIETLLWLEADRMLSPSFTQERLDVQKKVVIEEFKETCLNEPYGDLWHHLGELAFTHHSYQWPTIGKKISHVEQADLQQVNDFFSNFYCPNNAVISLSGNISSSKGIELVKKWFSHIPSSQVKRRNIPIEPLPTAPKSKAVKGNIPLTSLTLAFPMVDRIGQGFYEADLLSDILGNGRSSRLYRTLVKEQVICNSTDAFITGTTDPGLIVIEAKVASESNVDTVREAIWNELEKLKKVTMDARELQKIKNKAESNLIFSETSTLNKAMSLAYYDYIGDLPLINTEVERYQSITAESLNNYANDLFQRSKVSELVYHPLK